MGLEIKRKSILLIAGTLGQGGAEKQLFLLAKNLFRNQYTIEVVSFTSGELWESELKKIGIKVHNLSKKDSRLARLLSIIWLQYNKKFNVIFSFHFYTSLYAGFLGIIFPECLTIGSIRSDGKSEIEANGLLSYLHMYLPKLIIANNKIGLNYVQQRLKLNGSKLKLMSNAIITKPPTENFGYNRISKFVFIGRLVESKDPMMFVDIIGNLIQKNISNVQADIYGDGVLYNTLKDNIENKDLSKVIQMHGNVMNAGKNLNSQTVLIVTSLFEGTPNVVLEALANGALVVSRNFNGIRDLFSEIHPDYNKLIFDNVSGAIQIIVDINSNCSEYMLLQRAGIKYILKHHQLERQLDCFLDIIK